MLDGNEHLKFMQHKPKFNSKYSEDEIKMLIRSVPSWYHTFEFGNLTTDPCRTPINYQMWAAQGIPLDLKGKTVLDLGASDGFYSFLCEYRGAKRVLATDSHFFEGFHGKRDTITPKRFQICKDILDSNVEFRRLDVYDVDKLNEIFDIVLMFGLYYHLSNPLLAIKKISDITKDSLFLAGHVLGTNEPLMYYYYPYRLKCPNTDAHVIPSPECLLRLGMHANFKNVKTLDVMDMPIKKKRPDMIFGEEYQKVGTFKFSKAD